MKLRTPERRQPRPRDLLAIAGLLAVLLPRSVLAQDAAAATANPDEEIYVLSPFVVDASKDEGYRATNTLAGTRINTNLKDVAASITEITPEFFKDTAAVDINDVLVYMGNTESTRNYTEAPSSGIGGNDDRTSTNSMTANRVRGLNAATITRDYFISIGNGIGFDSYNIDRVTINRGPNSILFGMGDPSGVVNFAPKVAKLSKDSTEIGARYGSNNDIRATLDVNKVLIDGKLALRANVLFSDRGFQQKPAYFRDNRLQLLSTYKPFEKTTIHVSYEKVRQRSDNPNSITPLDMITAWKAQGRPTWDPRTDRLANTPANMASHTGGAYLGGTNYDGSLFYVFKESQGQVGRLAYWQPTPANVSIYNTIAVSDEKLVPLFTMNLRPQVSNHDLDTLTASLDQELAKNLFFNVSFIRESQDTTGYGWTRANEFGIFVDVNSYLPDGTINPHFGETYMPQRSLDSKYTAHNTNQSLRATLNYSLDLTKETGALKWFGQHAFTAYAERREVKYNSNAYNGTRTGSAPYLPQSDKINAGDWQLTRLRYLGGTPDTPAKYAPGVPWTEVSGVKSTYWDATAGKWAYDTYGEFFANKRRDSSKTTTSSGALVWQGFFLDGRVVGTAGIRRDKNENGSVAYTALNPSTGFLSYNETWKQAVAVSGNTKTVGVVVHPVKWISLFYNKSENFQPIVGKVNMFGDAFAPPAGKGHDYGIGFDLADGKLSFKINWYETKAVGAQLPWSPPIVEVQWELPWFDQVVIPGLAAKYGKTHTPYSNIQYGDSRLGDTSDQLSQGIEFEVIANPTKNWRIMANASRNKSSQTNIAGGLTRWVNEVLPTWKAEPWWTGTQTYDAGWGFNGNLQQYFNQFNTAKNLATYKAFEGQTSSQLRKWHFNLLNNYQFSEGSLKGWNFGGALRYESKSAIGYPAVITNGALTGLDLANPYYDDSQLNVDLWTGYTWKIWRNKATMNVQLNIRDVNKEEGLQPIVANSDGTPSQFRIVFGPTWYLSSTISF